MLPVHAVSAIIDISNCNGLQAKTAQDKASDYTGAAKDKAGDLTGQVLDHLLIL